LPFNWGLIRIQVCPAVLSCFQGIVLCTLIVHTYLPYCTLRHMPLTYITILDNSTNLLSLFKVLGNFPISLHPNSWVTYITWQGEEKSNTPIHLTSINQSFSSHAYWILQLRPLALEYFPQKLVRLIRPFEKHYCSRRQTLISMVSYILSSVASC